MKSPNEPQVIFNNVVTWITITSRPGFVPDDTDFKFAILHLVPA